MQSSQQLRTATTERALEELERLVSLFSSTELPSTCAKVFIQNPGKPSSKWSLGNQLLMLIAGTQDGRGYRQWQAVGRNVKKGTKAFHILAPIIIQKKVKRLDPQTKQEVEREEPRLVGFKTIPVFKYEDTEGKELEQYKPKDLPPLLNVAQRWGVSVKYDSTQDLNSYGYFQPKANSITLGSEDWDVFFHELAHKAHSQFQELKAEQDPEQETVAQLTAAVLSRLYGREVDNWTWQYIAHYSKEKSPEAVGRMCMRVLGKVQKIIQLILETEVVARFDDQMASI